MSTIEKCPRSKVETPYAPKATTLLEFSLPPLYAIYTDPTSPNSYDATLHVGGHSLHPKNEWPLHSLPYEIGGPP